MNSKIYNSALDTRNLLSEAKLLFAHRDKHSGVVKQIAIAINAIDNLFSKQESVSAKKR